MPLTRIQVLGYRGFKEAGILDFAVANGSEGSGLTVLTGPNNAGKSCILECLKARSGDDVGFSTGTRNVDIEEVHIKYTINGNDELVKSLSKGSSETSKTGIDKTFQVLVLPSRRAFNPEEPSIHTLEGGPTLANSMSMGLVFHRSAPLC